MFRTPSMCCVTYLNHIPTDAKASFANKWHACLGSHTKTLEKFLLRSCCYKVEAEAFVMELVYLLLGSCCW